MRKCSTSYGTCHLVDLIYIISLGCIHIFMAEQTEQTMKRIRIAFHWETPIHVNVRMNEHLQTILRAWPSRNNVTQVVHALRSPRSSNSCFKFVPFKASSCKQREISNPRGVSYFQDDLVTENKIQECFYFQIFVVILHFMYICLASPSKF